MRFLDFRPMSTLSMVLLLTIIAPTIATSQPRSDRVGGGRTFHSAMTFLGRSQDLNQIAAICKVDSVQVWFTPLYKAADQPVSISTLTVLRPVLNCSLGDTLFLITRTALWSQSGSAHFTRGVGSTEPVFITNDVVMIVAFPAASTYGADPHLRTGFVPLFAGYLGSKEIHLQEKPKILVDIAIDEERAAAVASATTDRVDLSSCLVRSTVDETLSVGEMVSRLQTLSEPRR